MPLWPVVSFYAKSRRLFHKIPVKLYDLTIYHTVKWNSYYIFRAQLVELLVMNLIISEKNIQMLSCHSLV